MNTVRVSCVIAQILVAGGNKIVGYVISVNRGGQYRLQNYGESEIRVSVTPHPNLPLQVESCVVEFADKTLVYTGDPRGDESGYWEAVDVTPSGSFVLQCALGFRMLVTDFPPLAAVESPRRGASGAVTYLTPDNMDTSENPFELDTRFMSVNQRVDVPPHICYNIVKVFLALRTANAPCHAYVQWSGRETPIEVRIVFGADYLVLSDVTDTKHQYTVADVTDHGCVLHLFWCSVHVPWPW